MEKSKNKVWKTYPEFPFIEANPQGDVRTLDRVVSNGRGFRIVKGRILKQYPDKDGYLYVQLSVNGKRIHRKVHRLVAQTFLPNHDSLPQLNHKNCDRTDNRVENLEWCTCEENIAYRDKCGHTAKNNAPKSPAFAINLATLEVSWFPSQMEASRTLGVNQGNIYSVIKGRYKQANGYWFTNADDNAVEVAKNKLHDILGDRIKDLVASDIDSDKIVVFVTKCLI